MKLNTTAALVAALLALATPALAETRVAEALELGAACVPSGKVAVTTIDLLATGCSQAQLMQVGALSTDIATILTVVTVDGKMTTDAIRDCTSSNAEVAAMTACLNSKTEAMTWITDTLPTFDMQHQLIFGGCALDNGSIAKAELDLVAAVECFKANAPT